MKKIIFTILSVIFCSLSLIGNSTIQLPSTFNGVKFNIENVVHVESLDSTVVVSCVISKEMNFVDLLSNSQNLVHIQGHGTFELDQNLKVIKSRFYLFKMKNAPDRFILVTPENDAMPNTILADHTSVVEGRTHMDSVMQIDSDGFFDHYQNSLIYKNNRIVGIEIKELMVMEEDYDDQLQEKSVINYEEDIWIEPIEDYKEETVKVFWEKHFDPISFHDGIVIGYHHLVNKEDKSQKASPYLNQEYVVFDAYGSMIYNEDIYWETPMQVIHSLKVVQNNGLNSKQSPSKTGIFILNEVSDKHINPSYTKENHFLYEVDKTGSQNRSIRFESNFSKIKRHNLTASEENGNLLLSAISLNESLTELECTLHWFDHSSLTSKSSKKIGVEVKPSFKNRPEFEIEHSASFQLNEGLGCIIYKIEETTEADIQNADLKDYFKTWYGFLTYNHRLGIVDFNVVEAFVPSDAETEISLIPNTKDELNFSIVRHNYFINSSKFEVVGKDLTLLKVNKNTGKIQKLEVDIKA